QRRALIQSACDVLAMSATPIPRSLALTYFGDLELTVIDELPPGRTPVKTYLVSKERHQDAYGFVRERVSAGEQAFVVAPLIEDSDELQALSVQELTDDLRHLLPELKIEMLHGRMKSLDKTAVMERFRARESDVLVSTTVIEVGVDVPNASVMVIENAERFGLATLHQLRGRVGRGHAQSYCILVAGLASEETMQRLRIIEQSTDGFEIAEADLKLRGPGELRGTRQSGMPELTLGDLARDTELIEKTRELAKRILAASPQLDAPWAERLRAELRSRTRATSFREIV
ncbi:MAG: DNA helicase RecG, partial [Deinococcus sp.]|nr:DNA helicase RecG [Deinococcus sp.]